MHKKVAGYLTIVSNNQDVPNNVVPAVWLIRDHFTQEISPFICNLFFNHPLNQKKPISDIKE